MSPERPSVARPSVVYVALFTSVGAWVPYVTLYYESIGLRLDSIGLLAALWAAVTMVTAPLWGAVADRFGSVSLPLVVAGTLAAGSAAVLAVAREPLVVAAAVALVAAGSAGLAPLLDSRTLELVGEHRDRYGQARAWGSIAFIVASLAIGLVVDRTGPQGLFLALVPAFALTGVAAYGLLGGGGGGPGRGMALTRADASLLLHPPLGAFFVGSTLMWTTTAAVSTFFSIHLVALGGDAQLVGLGWALGAIIEVPLMFLFPTLARRVGVERLLVLGAAAFAVRAGAWAVTGDPVLLVALAPLAGVGFALFYVGTVAYVARVTPPRVRATAQAVFSGTAFSLGSIAGATIGGQLAGGLTLGGLFGVSAVGTAIAAVVVWWAVVPGRGGAAVAAAPAATELPSPE